MHRAIILCLEFLEVFSAYRVLLECTADDGTLPTTDSSIESTDQAHSELFMRIMSLNAARMFP